MIDDAVENLFENLKFPGLTSILNCMANNFQRTNSFKIKQEHYRILKAPVVKLFNDLVIFLCPATIR